MEPTYKKGNSNCTTQNEQNQRSSFTPNPCGTGCPIPKGISNPHPCVFRIVPPYIGKGSRINLRTGPKPHRFFQPRRIYPDSQKQCCAAKYCCAPNNTADHHPIPSLVFILAQEALHFKISKKCVPQSDTHFYFLFTGNYTSSMIAISAASPRRAPVRVTLV